MGNLFGDLFYPGNPERRRRVIQLSQKLCDYMNANFRATNSLTEYLNKNVHGANFSPISVNEQETLKFNADVLLQRIIFLHANQVDFLERSPSTRSYASSLSRNFGGQLRESVSLE